MTVAAKLKGVALVTCARPGCDRTAPARLQNGGKRRYCSPRCGSLDTRRPNDPQASDTLPHAVVHDVSSPYCGTLPVCAGQHKTESAACDAAAALAAEIRRPVRVEWWGRAGEERVVVTYEFVPAEAVA